MGKSEAAHAITVLFPAISAIIVGLRCYSRYLGRNFGWDDGLMCAAMVMAIGESICGFGCERPIVSTIGVESGCWFPFSAWQVLNYTPEQLAVINRWSFSYQMIYHPLMGTIRMSIVVFLLRVGDTRRHIKWTLYVVLWLNIGYIIATTIANALQCDPVSYAYNRALMDRLVDGVPVFAGKCFQIYEFVLTSCTLSIFMDLILFPVPAMMVWNLTMPRKTKVAVAIVMSLGTLATAVSVGRFVVYYYQISPSKPAFTHNIGHTISIAESNTAIWAGCAPALRRLAYFFWPRLFDDYGSEAYNRDVTMKEASRESGRTGSSHPQGMELTPSSSNNLKQPRGDIDKMYGLETYTASQERMHEEDAGFEIEPARNHSTRTRDTDEWSEYGVHRDEHAVPENRF